MQSAAQLVITLTNDGQVQVQGPIANKMLCYGMLESARDAIRDFIAAQSKAGEGIEVADAGLMNRLHSPNGHGPRPHIG